jgi:hypothetical protein
MKNTQLEPLYIGNKCMSECDYYKFHTERGSELTCSRYQKKLQFKEASGSFEAGVVRLRVCKAEFK